MAVSPGRTKRPAAKAPPRQAKAKPVIATKPTRAKKPTPEPVNIAAAGRKALRGHVTPHPAIGRQPDGRIGQTMRLPPDAWKRLKRLAADEEKRVHDLFMEGLNLLFAKRKLPPLV